jgi:phage terminase large subunit-like protein
MGQPSLAELIAEATPSERRWLLNGVPANLLAWAWNIWARPEQMAPRGDWNIWMVKAGRGWGKTRTGAEWVRERARNPQERIHLIGRTAADVRDVMVEGESGLLRIFPDDERPLYEPSKRRVTFKSGAVASCFSADEPDALRGPQSSSFWADELAAWRFDRDAWDNLMFGFRLGQNPRGIITTTPRPTKLVREILAGQDTVVTGGSTYDNAGNIADTFLSKILSRYEGTRLGRQEIEAEVLEDNPGALWSATNIERHRVRVAPAMRRLVVAIDPAVTSNQDSDETGIVCAGLGEDGHGYILADLSGVMAALEWAKAAVGWYKDNGADRIIAEVNNGGDLVELTIRTVDPHVAYSAVHATRGKIIRAEPISALYEQGRVHHVGTFPMLEDQMTSFDPATSKKSPDRMDAAVWALTELMLGSQGEPRLRTL